MLKGMVKAILFDFWGTLVENGVYPSPVRQVKYILNLRTLPFPLYIIQFERSFMTQKFDDLYKAFENVCKEFKIQPNQGLLDNLVGMWNKNKLLAKPYPDTIPALEKLKKDYKLVLVSNTDCFSVEAVMEKYDMKKLFDELVLSYDVGMLKTNPEMFEKALKKMKVKKGDAIMVGDSIESDMRGAENAGIKPILIDRYDKRDFADRVTSLKELDKFLK